MVAQSVRLPRIGVELNRLPPLVCRLSAFGYNDTC